jgi:two-component system, OmpR family, sensor histidine kinase PrrB
VRPRSLSTRVALAAVAAVAIGLAVAGIAVVVLTARSDRRALDSDLKRVVDRRAKPALLAVRGTQGAAVGPDEDRFVRVIAANGITVQRGGAAVPEDFPEGAGARERPQTVHAGGEDWRVVSRTLAGGRTLQAAARLQPVRDRAARLGRIVFLVALVALAGSALLASALARVALAPLGRLRAAAREVGTPGEGPTARVPDDAGVAEVDELGGDLNAMLARLERAHADRAAALEAARAFAADAGHELRTPLTSLSINLSSARAGDLEALASAEAELARVSTLVEQLQALARGSSGPPQQVEALDLVDIADAAVTAARPRHPETTIDLEAPARTAPYAGDAAGLRAMLDNLIENAARHGGPHILVTVQDHQLDIEDDGPGIPPAERTHVLQRFGRGTAARAPGSGLGLSIAAAQAHRHGGTLTLTDSDRLGGLRATIEL